MYTEQRLKIAVSDFLNEVQQKTGVDDLYIDKMRPSVVKMFKDTSRFILPEQKEKFLQKALIRVKTQSDLKATLAHLSLLSEESKKLHHLSPDENRRISFTTALVINTFININGGFGKNIRVYS